MVVEQRGVKLLDLTLAFCFVRGSWRKTVVGVRLFRALGGEEGEVKSTITSEIVLIVSIGSGRESSSISMNDCSSSSTKRMVGLGLVGAIGGMMENSWEGAGGSSEMTDWDGRSEVFGDAASSCSPQRTSLLRNSRSFWTSTTC